MPDTLASNLADERGEAIRLLLRHPLLTLDDEPDGTRLAIRHGVWLVEWFENTMGWLLVVDPAAGFARLAKRSAQPDITRTLRRSRGDKRAFDRRRYQLLCLVCAELARHPVTTIGLLADALRSEATLDTTLRRERAALVDVLRTLADWGVSTHRGGDLNAYVDSAETNAILTTDSHRLHHLLSSATPPARIPDGAGIVAATTALLSEPRYGDAADAATENQRLRWTRHMAARLVFDDPVVHYDDVDDAVVSYLQNPSGRRWIRDRASDAGFELEERAEGLLAIDPSATATDIRFPSPLGTAGQLALLLIDALFTSRSDERSLGSLTAADLRRFVDDQLAQHPGWARTHREGEGPAHLVRQSAELLEGFGLVRIEPDGRVVARPALARYRVTAPTDNQMRML